MPLDRARLFTQGCDSFLLFKFPARSESVFELRFPEHWGSEKLKRKCGREARVHCGVGGVQWERMGPHRARATWSPGPEALEYDRDWSYVLDYEGQADHMNVRLALKYTGSEPWDGMTMLACLRNRMADAFVDPDGRRTWLYREGGPVTVHEMVKGRFESHRMVGTSVSGEHLERVIAQPLMAVFSEDKRWACAIAFAGTQSCSGNFGDIHCIHSNPNISGMKPGETRVLRGRVYCIPARGPEEVLARWMADREAVEGLEIA